MHQRRSYQRAWRIRRYLEFLKTPECRATFKRALERAGYRCEECGSGSDLEVHHLTYERLGCELPEDLRVLCRRCHETAHAPRNRQKFLLELYGQQRLFDRWDEIRPAYEWDEPDAA